MKYESNGTLKKVLDFEKSSMSLYGWDDTKKLINIYGIASGMKYLHSLNIIHCDLNPYNIFEDEHFFPNICNFGLSKRIQSNSDNNSPIDRAYGTLMYVPQEVLEEYYYSKAGDVYSFAMTMYEILDCEIRNK